MVGKTIDNGGIPEGWGMAPLKDIAVVNEKTIDKKYPHSEIAYIDIASVDKGRMFEPKRLLRSEAPSRAQRIVRDKDILLSTVRPNLKHFAFVKTANPNTIASTGFAVISSKSIDPSFLYYYLTIDKYTDYLSAIADSHTSTYPAFNPDVLENSEIPLPPENEQRSIAKILSDLDAKIDLNRRMNETLEQIARAIFKKWFVDFEFPGYEKTKFVDGLPEGWHQGVLGEIVKVESGKRPGDKSENKTQEFTIPLIGASSVMGFVREALYNEPILIIGRVGTHGIVQRVSHPVFPSDNTLVIQSKYFEFVYQILKTIDYAAFNVGSTQPLITQTTMNNYSLILPKSDVLDQFENNVSSFFRKIRANNCENEFLSQIRDTLLPKLMLGEIRVG